MNFHSLFQPPYDIFTIVTLFTLGLSSIEIVSFIFGASISKVFGANHDADIHFDSHHLDSHDSICFSHIDGTESVNLFNLGQVPFLVILLSLTSFFSFFGFGTHLLFQNLNLTVSNLLVVPISVGLSSFFTYKVTKWWKRVFPNIESYAVSERSFVGKIGEINLGEATSDNSVEVAVYDEHGAKHYIMASVALKNIKIGQNQKAIIVHKNKKGSYFILPYLEKKELIQQDKNILTQEAKNNL